MFVKLEFVDSTFEVFIFIFESERKAPAEARVMVASPKFGTKKTRSEKNEDQSEVASVGCNEICSHPDRISMQNDGKWMKGEIKKLTLLHSLQLVEKEVSNHMTDKMMETSSSAVQTSDVKLNEKPWQKSKESVASIFVVYFK